MTHFGQVQYLVDLIKEKIPLGTGDWVKLIGPQNMGSMGEVRVSCDHSGVALEGCITILEDMDLLSLARTQEERLNKAESFLKELRA